MATKPFKGYGCLLRSLDDCCGVWMTVKVSGRMLRPLGNCYDVLATVKGKLMLICVDDC